MCALLSGLYIGGDDEGVGGGLAKEGKNCVFKRSYATYLAVNT